MSQSDEQRAQAAVTDPADDDELRPRALEGDVPSPATVQVRTVRTLGLLLPGIMRVLELRRVKSSPPLWRVTLADAPEGPAAGALAEPGLEPRAHSLRAFITFETDDLALLQQLRPRRLRLAVDLLEMQRGGPEVGQLELP